MRKLRRIGWFHACVLLLAISGAGIGCRQDEASIPDRRLVAELEAEWVEAFPDAPPLPDEGLEVIPLMAMEWTIPDYEDRQGESPVATGTVVGGKIRDVYRTAPPTLFIHANEPSPACFASPWIRVRPRTHYTLIGYVRTQDLVASGPIRGTFFVEERSELGDEMRAFPNRDGTTPDWEREVLTFTTGDEADALRVSACLAGPGGGTGSAWFDDIVLVRHTDASLDDEALTRLTDMRISRQWRYDVASSTRPRAGLDAAWGEDPEADRFRSKIGLGNDVRNALLAPVKTRYRIPVEAPAGTRFRGAIGLPNPDGVLPPGAVRFEVRFEQPESYPVVLLERELRLDRPGDPDRWHPFDLVLPTSASGELVLSTDSDASLMLADAVFGNPTVVPPATLGRGRRVILVSIDTLRADRLGVYGAELPTSPRLDALAAQGVVFDNAHAPSPWTLPSHRTMLTGLDPFTHGALMAEQSALRADIDTLGEVLQAEGFATAGIHGGGFVSPAYGFAEGFDRYLEIAEPREAIDAAIDIATADPDRDLFLFLHSYQVHAPYHEEPEELPAFGPRFEELREQLTDVVDPRLLGSHAHLSRQNRSGEPLPPAQLEMAKLLYDGGVRAMDRELGRLLDALEASDLLAKSLIVVTSDHGEGFDEHGLLLHANSLYRELLHVPLVVYQPGRVPAGARVEAHVGSADIVPTTLELLGIPTRPGLDGRSLVSLIDGAAGRTDSAAPATDPDAPRPVFGSLVDNRVALFSAIAGDQKYILYAASEQLYDLAADPLETVDRAASDPAGLSRSRQRILPEIAKLPGLHVVAVGDAAKQQLEGSIGFEGLRDLPRSFFVDCATCVSLEGSRLAVRLPLEGGVRWLNLPEVRHLADVEIALQIAGEPTTPRPVGDLFGDSPAPGLYVFVTAGADAEEAALSPERLEQLEALGYLE